MDFKSMLWRKRILLWYHTTQDSCLTYLQILPSDGWIIDFDAKIFFFIILGLYTFLSAMQLSYWVFMLYSISVSSLFYLSLLLLKFFSESLTETVNPLPQLTLLCDGIIFCPLATVPSVYCASFHLHFISELPFYFSLL